MTTIRRQKTQSYASAILLWVVLLSGFVIREVRAQKGADAHVIRKD